MITAVVSYVVGTIARDNRMKEVRTIETTIAYLLRDLKRITRKY